MVISSDTLVFAIANVLAKALGPDITTAASYGSISNPAAKVSFPLIMRGNSNFDTQFNVQNAGTTAANVTVAYTPGSAGNANCKETAVIQPNAAKTFSQIGNACLGAKFIGSAEVTSDQPIVGTAQEGGPDTLFAYNGFTGGSTNPVLPLVNANNSGFITGIQVQNTGNAATDVTISYKASLAGSDCTETKTVAAGGSTTFALGAFNGTEAGENCANAPTTFIGSASVTGNSASQPVVVIVNQLNVGSGKGAAYNGSDPSVATDKATLPLIMDNNSGFFTGYSVINVGTDPVNITCTYAAVGGHTPTADTATGVAPGSAFTVNNNGKLRKDAQHGLCRLCRLRGDWLGPKADQHHSE